jgi:hypothetical protein
LENEAGKTKLIAEDITPTFRGLPDDNPVIQSPVFQSCAAAKN